MSVADSKQVMIITGGSRGIGAAVARQAAVQGFHVVINYAQRSDDANALAEELRSSGHQAVAIQGDVAEEADVVRLFEKTRNNFGPVTVLVNNAGISGGFSRVEGVSAQTVSDVMGVNVVGAFLCCREAIRQMSTNHGGNGGAIINVSSRASQYGGAGEWVHYAASKGAMDTLTLGLSREVAGEGIRVNAVAPGFVDTDLHASAGDPNRASRLAQSTPIGRPATAGEIADVVLWLAGEASSYVTGAIVAAAGGR